MGDVTLTGWDVVIIVAIIIVVGYLLARLR